MVIWTILLVGAQAYNFFVITDIHLDIAYDPIYNASALCHSVGVAGKHLPIIPAPDRAEMGRFGCDSPLSLLSSALSAMQSIDPSPSYILVTGDLIGHSTYRLLLANGTYDTAYTSQLVRNTFQEVATEFNTYFPETQVVFALGNNDGFGDYQLPELQLNQYLYSLWAPLNPSLPIDFMDNSFYTCDVEVTGQKLIVLSSNFFSVSINSTQTAFTQLDWLSSQLQSAQSSNQNVIIAMHIPPGPGMFAGKSLDWQDQYISKFSALVQTYKANIDFIFTGHQHQAGFQLIGDSGLTIVIHPAITPAYNNNPGFRQYRVEDDGEDYTDYVMDLMGGSEDWEEELVFSDFSGLRTFDYASLYKELQDSPIMLFQYLVASRGLSHDVGVHISNSEFCSEIMDIDSEQTLLRDALCTYRYISNFEFELCRLGLLPVD